MKQELQLEIENEIVEPQKQLGTYLPTLGCPRSVLSTALASFSNPSSFGLP